MVKAVAKAFCSAFSVKKPLSLALRLFPCYLYGERDKCFVAIFSADRRELPLLGLQSILQLMEKTMDLPQPMAAGIFLLLGFCFGLFFDIYRVVRLLGNLGKMATAFGDLLFWFTYTAWVYIVLLRVNSGEVRVFLLICLALGAVGYFASLSRPLRWGWQWLFGKLIIGITWLLNALNTILEKIIRLALWPYHFCSYLLVQSTKLLRFLLSPLRKSRDALVRELSKRTRWWSHLRHKAEQYYTGIVGRFTAIYRK